MDIGSEGKSPLGARGGTSVPAVVTAPLAPTSPRLRNSRERQPLQPSPKARSRPFDSPSEAGHSPLKHSFDSQQLEASPFGYDEIAATPGVPKIEHRRKRSEARSFNEENRLSSGQPQGLSLQTSILLPKSSPQAVSAITEFDESPILGLPGSFVLTPPIAQEEPDEPPLLPQNCFPISSERACSEFT